MNLAFTQDEKLEFLKKHGHEIKRTKVTLKESDGKGGWTSKSVYGVYLYDVEFEKPMDVCEWVNVAFEKVLKERLLNL